MQWSTQIGRMIIWYQTNGNEISFLSFLLSSDFWTFIKKKHGMLNRNKFELKKFSLWFKKLFVRFSVWVVFQLVLVSLSSSEKAFPEIMAWNEMLLINSFSMEKKYLFVPFLLYSTEIGFCFGFCSFISLFLLKVWIAEFRGFYLSFFKSFRELTNRFHFLLSLCFVYWKICVWGQKVFLSFICFIF